MCIFLIAIIVQLRTLTILSEARYELETNMLELHSQTNFNSILDRLNAKDTNSYKIACAQLNNFFLDDYSKGILLELAISSNDYLISKASLTALSTYQTSVDYQTMLSLLLHLILLSTHEGLLNDDEIAEIYEIFDNIVVSYGLEEYDATLPIAE